MVLLKRVVLDVLKPRHPNILELANTVAALGPDYRVTVRVEEVDDKTESVTLIVEGDGIDFDTIQGSIQALGGSLHSVDEVEVAGMPQMPDDEGVG